MVSVIRPLAAIVLASTVTLTGCSQISEATSDATESAKAEASKAASEAIDNATESAKQKALDEVKKRAENIDPNKITESDIASALTLLGIENSSAIAKEIKESGPYTTENVASEVKTILEKYEVDEAKIEQVTGLLSSAASQ